MQTARHSSRQAAGLLKMLLHPLLQRARKEMPDAATMPTKEQKVTVRMVALKEAVTFQAS